MRTSRAPLSAARKTRYCPSLVTTPGLKFEPEVFLIGISNEYILLPSEIVIKVEETKPREQSLECQVPYLEWTSEYLEQCALRHLLR